MRGAQWVYTHISSKQVEPRIRGDTTMTPLAQRMCEMYRQGASLDTIAAMTCNTRKYVVYVLMGCAAMGVL
jgi:hypothetical protein